MHYKTVGQLVAQCVREDKSLADLTLEEYKTHSDAFENDVYEAIDLKTCVRGRKVIGDGSGGSNPSDFGD